MVNFRKHSFHLFRLAGIDVSLHWSWFLVALYEISARSGSYSSPIWNVLEVLAFFGIITMHEFGHALACRQTGGKADHIMLWPLGGVAFVNPPPRPGATLWSIAAGPLVNVALYPVFLELAIWSRAQGWALTMPNVYTLVQTLAFVNIVLLVFNLLPIYPLDGGQILRSLLWFVLGRARSLGVATVIGFAGVAAMLGFAFWTKDFWLGLIAIFALMSCWGGLQQARVLSKFAKLPRRPEFACPTCKSSPPLGAFWKCSQCQTRYDTFLTHAVCPHCGAREAMTQCADCGRSSPVGEWSGRTILSPG
jgi:Zn-dependent protease